MLAPVAVAMPWLGAVVTATLVAVPPLKLRAIELLAEFSTTVGETPFAVGAVGRAQLPIVLVDAVYWVRLPT